MALRLSCERGDGQQRYQLPYFIGRLLDMSGLDLYAGDFSRIEGRFKEQVQGKVAVVTGSNTGPPLLIRSGLQPCALCVKVFEPSGKAQTKNIQAACVDEMDQVAQRRCSLHPGSLTVLCCAGLGYQIAKILLTCGCRVIIATRNPTKGDK